MIKILFTGIYTLLDLTLLILKWNQIINLNVVFSLISNFVNYDVLYSAEEEEKQAGVEEKVSLSDVFVIVGV